MTFPRLLLSFLLLSSLLCGLVRAEPASDTERWVGEYRLDDTAHVIVLQLPTATPHPRTPVPTRADATQEPGSEPRARVDFPALGQFGVPVQELRMDDGKAAFALQLGPERVSFEGRHDLRTMRGRVLGGAHRGRFTLHRTLAPEVAHLARITGSYAFDSGEVVDIAPMDEIGGQLVFLDHRSLRTGPLLALSASRFVGGPSLGVPYPFAIEVEVGREHDPEFSALRWREGGVVRHADRVAPHRQEAVQLALDVTLAGSLWIPREGAGPHPAILLAHGSGDQTRNIGVWIPFFLRQGYAVLSLDKRGNGGSGGAWTGADLDRIASDWLAGVEYLKSREDIDPRRIGVHGSSQGGWTAMLMAQRSDDIAFAIVRAGSGVSLLDTMVHEVGWNVREAGHDEIAAREAETAARELFTLAAQRAPWQEFAARAAHWAAKPWAAAAWPLHMSEDGWGRPWTALNAHYDAAAALAQVRIPVLWFLAEQDHNVPSETSAVRLRSAAAFNPDFRLVRLKHTGHAFIADPDGNNRDVGRGTHMAAGYWDTMQAWLRERRERRER
jgi:pimeloyl-ACP methyl ester carboxylesterase